MVRFDSSKLKGKKGQTDWQKIDDSTDREIDQQISENSDLAPHLKANWFKQANWIKPEKEAVHIRLDSDIISFFKEKGKGYQTRINQVLRAFMEAHK